MKKLLTTKCRLCGEKFQTYTHTKIYCTYQHRLLANQWKKYPIKERFKRTPEELKMHDDYVKRLKREAKL